MKRGEIWTMAGGPGIAGKPRPALIVQDDRYVDTATVIVCPVTTTGVETAVMRLVVEPNPANGLRQRSLLMIDKILPLPRPRLRRRIGVLDPDDLIRVDLALLVFLGLAASPGPR